MVDFIGHPGSPLGISDVLTIRHLYPCLLDYLSRPLAGRHAPILPASHLDSFLVLRLVDCLNYIILALSESHPLSR